MAKQGELKEILSLAFGGGAGASGTDAPSLNGVVNLEYGVSQSHNGKHFVEFRAKVYTAPEQKVEGEDKEPVNSKRNLVVTRPPMRATKGFIKLYLPAQINVSQKSNYGEPEIGGLIAGGVNAVNNFNSGEGFFGTAKSVAEGLASDAGTSMVKAAGELGDTIGVTGASAAIAIKTGITRNNNTELMFEGVDRRSFSFTFRMLPHDSQEAATIQSIVKHFRFHMAPHVPTGTTYGRTLVAPSVFAITYSHSDNLHKISDCVLESIDVKYGGERPQFFHDNRPTETEITLQFKELEIITKSRINEGY